MTEIYNENCLFTMINRNIKIDLLVTSPPYFNSRAYSHWDTLDEYMNNMSEIFKAAYDCLGNHRYCIVNVGDVTCPVWRTKCSMKKIPLGAMFIIMLENIGFEFVDDFIWDKGEPQSKRHLGNPPYPFYQYPVNCYEHILVFVKHRLDKTKIPCPDCGKVITVSNSCSGVGVQSWECKNPMCPSKSAHGRGKRFSERSVMMNNYKTENNLIDYDYIKEWRRDIVRINPVIKINSKGVNTLGHTAPYPFEIPEMAIRFYSGVGDVVFDPFLGSGTTGIAARSLNRNFIGCEINNEFYNIAVSRIYGYTDFSWRHEEGGKK